MKETIKGYVSVIIAAFFVALSAVGIKLVEENNTPDLISFYWMLSALISCFIFLVIKKEIKKIIPEVKKYWGILTLLGIINGISLLCWFYSINVIGPSISSFLGRIGTIVLVFLSVIFLKEKFNLFEGIGSIMALAGVLLITFSPVDLLGSKIIYIATGSTLYGIGQLISKNYVQKISTSVLTFILTFIITLILFLNLIFFSKLELPEISGPVNFSIILIVPFLSEILSTLLVYSSYIFIDVGKSQIIRSSFPFIVVVYSYFFFRTIPLPHQLIGGTLIVAGVMALIGFRRINKGVRYILNSE